MDTGSPQRSVQLRDQFGLLSRLKFETRSWFSLFGLVFGIFVLVASSISFFQQMFDLQLIPVFHATIDDFRRFTNIFFGKTIYEPLTYVMQSFVDGFVRIVSNLFSVAVPSITVAIPAWFRDLGLISTILLRAQTQAMSYSPPISTLTLSEQESLEWDWALLNANKVTRILVSISWAAVLTVYRVKKLAELPFRVLGFKKSATVIGILVGGALMLGFFYMTHDVLSAIATRYLSSVRATSHRNFLAWTVFSLSCALLASLGFFVWNGFMLS